MHKAGMAGGLKMQICSSGIPVIWRWTKPTQWSAHIWSLQWNTASSTVGHIWCKIHGLPGGFSLTGLNLPEGSTCWSDWMEGSRETKRIPEPERQRIKDQKWGRASKGTEEKWGSVQGSGQNGAPRERRERALNVWERRKVCFPYVWPQDWHCSLFSCWQMDLILWPAWKKTCGDKREVNNFERVVKIWSSLIHRDFKGKCKKNQGWRGLSVASNL